MVPPELIAAVFKIIKIVNKFIYTPNIIAIFILKNIIIKKYIFLNLKALADFFLINNSLYPIIARG